MFEDVFSKSIEEGLLIPFVLLNKRNRKGAQLIRKTIIDSGFVFTINQMLRRLTTLSVFNGEIEHIKVVVSLLLY